MRHRLSFPASPAAGSVWSPGRWPARRAGHAFAVGAVVAGLAVGLPASPSGPGAPLTAAVTAFRGTAETTVPLVTGGEVTVTTTAGGQPSYLLRPLAGSRGAVLWYQAPGGDRFMVPVQSPFTPNGTFFTAGRRTFAGGRRYSLAWAHGPLAPGFGQHHGVPAPVLDPRTYPWTCLACAAGRTLSLVFDPAGDSELDHATEAIGPARYHFTLFRNGTRLFTGSGSPGAVVHPIPRMPASYRAVLDVAFSGVPGFSQSTRTHTDLTVPYTPAAGPQAALPAEDTCAGQSPATPCQILPALTLNYLLATNEHNTSSAPVQVMRLRVVHLGYDGKGSHARITSAAVAVSFNGGTSWHQATLTGSNGHYNATWPNPASARGSDPEIKVTAHDALGGSITQTITSAYAIAAATPEGSTR